MSKKKVVKAEGKELRQEECECGCRSYYILCNHHTTYYTDNTLEGKHNFVVLCSNCGKINETLTGTVSELSWKR